MELTFWQKQAISTKDRLEWYRSMSVATEAGIAVAKILPTMSKAMAKTKHPLVPMLDIIIARMHGRGKLRSHSNNDNRSFANCLEDLIPEDEAMLIASGEKTGNVAVGLANAVTMVTEKREMMASVYEAMAKPAGQVVAMLALLMFFSMNLLPKFEATKPRAVWPHSAQLLGSVADNSIFIAGGVVALLVITALLIQFVLPRWTGEAREWCDRHMFPFNLVANVSGASFLTSIASYAMSGIPFTKAVADIKGGAMPYMASQCSYIEMAMRNGKSEQQALCGLSIISIRYHWIIEVYGLAANQSVAYRNISKELVRGVQTYITRLFKVVIGNLLLFGIMGMILWIYGSMFGIALAGNAVFGT